LFFYSEGKITYKKLTVEGLKFEIIGNKIIVATLAGIEIYDLKSRKLIMRTLSNTFFTNLFVDHEGGLWASTFGDGIYYFKNLDLLKYHFPDYSNNIFKTVTPLAEVSVATSWQRELIVFNRQGDLLEEYGGAGLFEPTFFFKKEDDLSHLLFPLQERKYVYKKTWNCFLHPDGKKYPLENPYKNKEVLAIRTTNSFRVVLHTTDEVILKPLDIPMMETHIVLNDSTLLVATHEGLYKVKNYEEATPYLPNEGLLRKKMLDIKAFRDGYVIATENGLIYLKDQTPIPLYQVNLQEKEILSYMLVKDNNEIWLAGNNGLSRLQFGDKLIDLEINRLNTTNGLPSNEVIHIDEYHDSIWFSTKGGICVLPRKTEFGQRGFSKQYFHIDSIRIGGKRSFFGKDEIIYTEGENLELYFTQISYSNNRQINYQYRIKEIHDSWISTTPNYLSLPHLQDGEYTLELKPQAKNIRNNSPKKIHIKVLPPFWKSWTAIFLYITISFILIILSFLFAIRRTANKKQADIDRLNLEMKALISQMNPHFTFNTINSIQHYIIKKDKNDALDYLSQFALLIRRALDYSRREFISIKEELDFIQIYVGLEKKRFDQDFDLIIQTSCKKPHEEIKLPALLLQPIIENAIIHGISRVSHKGIIHLQITEFDEYFSILIKDNGYGIDFEKKKHTKYMSIPNKKSLGLDILKQRISLYNSSFYQESDIQVHSEPKKGTEILIKLRKRE
jgi:hypothetical protein